MATVEFTGVGGREDTTVYLERVETARLADVAPNPDKAITDPPKGALGKDGDSWYMSAYKGGPDINPDLMGAAKYEVYREMRMTDPAVRSLEWLYRLLLRSADWSIDPAKTDPQGEAHADLVADCVAKQFGLEDHDGDGKLDKTWGASLAGASLFLPYGAHGEELVWGDPEVYEYEGEPLVIKWLTRLAPRFASSVTELVVDELTGRITKIEQDIPDSRPVPGSKLCWYAFDDEANPWGVSLFRAAYGPWLFKKGLLIGSAIAWDRYASGIPVVRHPSGAAAKKEAAEIGRGARTHERAWVTLEGPDPQFGGEWDFKIETAQISDPVSLLRHYDYMIAQAGLQQFSTLGTTERGSRAVGDTLSEYFYLSVQAVADHIREQRQRFVIRRFIDVNFGPDVPAPKLRVSKIQSRNIAILTAAVADLAPAGFSFADRDTQNDFRDMMDLRHLPEPAAGAINDLPNDVGIEPTGIAVEGGSILAKSYAALSEHFISVPLEDGSTIMLPRGALVAK